MPLPRPSDFTDNSVTESQFKYNLTQLIQYIAELKQYIDSLVIDSNTEAVALLLDNLLAELAAAGAGANGWTSSLVVHNDISLSQIIDDLSLKAKGIEYVTPEMFGSTGGLTDNALIVAAVDTGLPVLCMGDEYKLSDLTLNKSATLVFGENTKIINTQTSGTKKPSITFAGQGLTGSAVTVTGLSASNLDSVYHTDTIIVSDATQFKVGDTVLIQENMPLREEVNYPSMPKLLQDFNYREFATIMSIVGNEIKFQEYLRFPYKASNSLTLQKVAFLENAHVAGGVWIGGNGAGGGVKFSHCRRSSSKNIKGLGLSDSNRNGGAPVYFENCWESNSENTDGHLTLYSHFSSKNQSCLFQNIKGKRTSNGGVMSGGDRFCHVGPIVEDSPGISNGDGLSVSNGSRHNTYGPFTISGARCYTLWLHESCDDNIFLPLKSRAGITGGAYVFGDRNNFVHLDIKGHPSFGLGLSGNDNFANVDIDVDGSAVNILQGTSGNRVFGRSVSRGTSTISYDLLIGNVRDTVVEISGGTRGIGFSGATEAQVLNHTNTIEIVGKKPFSLRKLNMQRGGYIWNSMLSAVSSSSPKQILEPKTSDVGDTNGLGPVVASTPDSGVCYKLCLKTNTTIADTYTEVLAFSRQGTWAFTEIKQGANAAAPILRANSSGELEVTTNSTTALSIFVAIQRF